MDMYYPVDFGEYAVAPAVITAAASGMDKERILGRCWVVDEGGISWTIIGYAQGYLGLYEKQTNPPLPSDDDVRIVVPPTHGQLMRFQKNSGKSHYFYQPDKGYFGKDRIESLVSMWDGKAVRIIDNIIVQSMPIDSPGFDSEEFCPKHYWKISQSQETGSYFADLASWIRSSSLSWLLSNVQSVSSGFADLYGVSVAQTTDTDPTARITLDTDAAGYGWFIDYTPYLNEERNKAK
jgi:hypothetical protein